MQIKRWKASSFIRVPTLLLLCATLRVHGASDTPDKFAVVSPDGKFVFRQTMESEDGDAAFGVIDARTKRSVLIDPGANLPPMEDSIACIWSPDSKRFAVNARLAGRYETTELFEWTGKDFQHTPSIENTITALLAADRKAQLKKAGVPENTPLRHIWDMVKTLKWDDGDTLKVLASSTRSYATGNGSKDTANVVSSFTFTLKLEKNSRPKILTQTALPSGKAGYH
jgi:hypothetical protein